MAASIDMDLPEPDLPTMPSTLPAASVRSTPRTASCPLPSVTREVADLQQRLALGHQSVLGSRMSRSAVADEIEAEHDGQDRHARPEAIHQE